MKLYIPTCTLNFNNIFSTESISPAIHYIKRGFGNKRYYKVEANNLDNVVLLYSKYPNYHVDNEDLENAPLVFEIEAEDYDENKFTLVNEINDVKVYTSTSTIYFNPFHCNIYFENHQDEVDVLTKAEQSLENKYSSLYRNNFKIRKTGDSFISNECFNWEESYLDLVTKVESSDSNYDVIIDRIKGCFICYLLGANMSLSKDISRLKQLARMMKNTLSAIVYSPDKRPTELQDETLLSYIKEFNAIYSCVNKDSMYNKEIVSKRLTSPSTGLDSETIKLVLKDLRLEDIFNRSLNLRPVYNANDLYNCLYSTSTDSYNIEIQKMFDAIERVERSELTNNSKKHISELFTIEGKEIKVTDPIAGTGTFYASFLNSQIKGEYEKFMEEKGTEELLSIACVGGTILKGYMPDRWENSDFQYYINSLLANIQEGKSFDIFSIDNVIMQSFAAFCQKGEEIDRLIDYMLQCGFNEYRFALGIYGATRGFAALPKTFTNALINGSQDYYIEFFNYLHKFLFGFDLNNTVIPDIKKQNYGNVILETLSPSTINETDTNETKFGTFNDHKEIQIPECLKALFASKEFKELKDEQKYYKEESLKCWSGKLDNDFISSLNSIQPKGRTKTKWNKCVKLLENRLKNDANNQPIDFNKSTGPYFYNDPNVWREIEPLIPKEYRKKIYDDLKWFQDQISKPKGQRGYYESIDELDNRIVIEKFCSLKKEKSPYFTPELREKIKSKLKELYHVV